MTSHCSYVRMSRASESEATAGGDEAEDSLAMLAGPLGNIRYGTLCLSLFFSFSLSLSLCLPVFVSLYLPFSVSVSVSVSFSVSVSVSVSFSLSCLDLIIGTFFFAINHIDNFSEINIQVMKNNFIVC